MKDTKQNTMSETESQAWWNWEKARMGISDEEMAVFLRRTIKRYEARKRLEETK